MGTQKAMWRGLVRTARYTRQMMNFSLADTVWRVSQIIKEGGILAGLYVLLRLSEQSLYERREPKQRRTHGGSIIIQVGQVTTVALRNIS